MNPSTAKAGTLTFAYSTPDSFDPGNTYYAYVLNFDRLYATPSYQLNKQLTLVPNPNWTQNEDTEARQLASKIVVDLNVNAADVDNRLLAGDAQVDFQGSGVQAQGARDRAAT